MRRRGLNARVVVVALAIVSPIAVMLLLLTILGGNVRDASVATRHAQQARLAAARLEADVVAVQNDLRERGLPADGRLADSLHAKLAQFDADMASVARSHADDADETFRLARTLRFVGLVAVPLIAVLAAFLVSRLVTRPLRRIGDGADRLRAGDLSARVEERGAGEVAHLAESFNTMAASMQRSQDALENASQLNRAMLEAASDGYVAVDEDGVVLAFTPQAGAIFGYTEEEVVGHLFADVVLPEDQRAAHHKRRRETLAGERTSAPYRLRTKRRDGRPVLVEIVGTAIRDGDRRMAVYFVRDVGDEVLREEERRAEEAVSHALVQAGPEDDLLLAIIAAMGGALGCREGTFWELDEHARSIRCTRIWNAADYDVPELDRMLRAVRYDLDGPADTSEPVIVAWRTAEVQWATVGLHTPATQPQPGTATIHTALLVPVIVEGEVMGLFGLGTESAEPPDEVRWSALRSIADLVGQVVSRRRAEREADRLKNEFFALVSHELRTPLTSVIGYLEILREEGAGPLNADQERYLGVMDRSARRLLRLVGDLLFVAQIEAGNLKLDRQPTDLRQVALDAIEAAAPRAQQGRVELVADTEPVRIAAGDGDRLGQLVDNLVSNAIKFTPEDGVVTVRLRRTGDRAVLEVSDTGPGIAADDQERLFERFFRTEEARKNAVPGIGLGLSIAQAIAVGHGGALDVESAPGQGATFRVTLPAAS